MLLKDQHAFIFNDEIHLCNKNEYATQNNTATHAFFSPSGKIGFSA